MMVNFVFFSSILFESPIVTPALNISSRSRFLRIVSYLQRRAERWKLLEIGVLVISPTRELATQINEVLTPFLDTHNKAYPDRKLQALLLLGGNSVEADVAVLRNKGANIIVATPGRLQDILEHHTDVCLKPALKSLVNCHT